MRNWNHWRKSRPALLCGYCQPTYEELKRVIKKYGLDEYASLPAYLWGIETGGLYGVILAEWEIASLPMRNWNSSVVGGSSNSRLNCQPTYEELKPNRLDSGISSFWYCQPTYEELKPINNFIHRDIPFRALPAFLWGILLKLIHLI